MPEDTHTDLFDLLRAMLPLYDDGTMQASTRTLATVLDTLSKDQESVDAFARFSHREGYRPMQFGLGIARPALRYSGIREVITSSLGALGSGGVAEAPSTSCSAAARSRWRPTPRRPARTFRRT